MDNLQQELEFLAVQAGDPKDQHAQIQKLSPAQMAALASGMGRKHGIKIHFGNFDTAATDGTTIALPLTSKENSWIVRGFLDHESAHIRLTNFDLVPNRSVFIRSIWNIIEDIRIEARMPLLYPGMASNFRALIRELRNTNPGFFKVPPDSPPDMIMACYISLLLRAMFLKQPVADLAIEARNVFIDTFGRPLEADLYRVISKIDNVDSPQDVLDLVEEIMQLLQRHVSEPEAQQGPPDDTDTNAGTGASGQQNCGGDDQSARGSQGSDPTDTADTELQQGQEAESGSGSDQDPDMESTEFTPDEDSGTDGGSAQPQPGDSRDSQAALDNNNLGKSDAIQAALDSQVELGDFGDQLRDLARAKEMSSPSGNYEVAGPAHEADLIGTGYTQQCITAHSRLVAQLSSRLRGLLQAQDLQHATPGTTGNRIARNRLHRIKTGDPKLFLRKVPQKMVNTAIHLLIDNSASMGDSHRFYQTREVVFALAKALAPIRGISLGMTVFPAFYPYNRHNGRYGIPVAPVLTHGQQLHTNMLYPPGPKGQTPLAASVRYVASTMLGLVEPRKILVVLTDGEPDCERDAEIAIQEAVKLGIEVAALGIEQLTYPNIFSRFEIVRSVDELPEKTFSLLEQLLTNK